MKIYAAGSLKAWSSIDYIDIDCMNVPFSSTNLPLLLYAAHDKNHYLIFRSLYLSYSTFPA